MIDKRDLILQRILAILETLAPGKAERNKLWMPQQMPPDKRLYLLDGDEQAREDAFGRNRPPTGTLIIAMSPEIIILQGGPHEDVGTLVNLERLKIIYALSTDSELLGLVWNNDIRYRGLGTGFAYGRSMVAEAGMSVTLHYALTARDLTQES